MYLLFTGHEPLTSDAEQYDTIARNLASGHGFSACYPQLYLHETAFRPPLYPMLLAAFYWVFGASAGLALGLNVALGVGVVALTFSVVQRTISRRAAIWAAIAVAVMPNLIANDTFALDEPLALLLILLLVDFMLRRKWIWAGVAARALTLSFSPEWQFLVIVLAVWLIIKFGWKRALVFAIAAGLVVTPWAAEIGVQVGKPTVATSNGFIWAAMYSPPAQEHHEFIDPTRNSYFNSYRLLQFDESAWTATLSELGLTTLNDTRRMSDMWSPAILPHCLNLSLPSMWVRRSTTAYWGGEDRKSYDVNDYAYKAWSGMMAPYSLGRWEVFFDYQRGLFDGKAAPAPDFYAWERAWADGACAAAGPR